MKNNNVTSPPEIKKNLFKLTKKSKNEFNKLIPNINFQAKAINESKELRFFSLNEIPEDLLDMDLIEIYKSTKGTFLYD